MIKITREELENKWENLRAKKAKLVQKKANQLPDSWEARKIEARIQEIDNFIKWINKLLRS